MAELGSRRDRQTVLAVTGVLLLAAFVALALTARASQQDPSPIAGLSAEQVTLARAGGLDLRIDAIATEARASQVEEVAIAALGEEAFEWLRVEVSLALVEQASGERLGHGLVWVVFADGVTPPPLGPGESAGVADPAHTFVVVDPESLETLTSVVEQWPERNLALP